MTLDRTALAFDLTLPARTRTGSWVYASELLTQLQRMPQVSVTVLNHPKRWRGHGVGEQVLNAAELTLWMQVALPRRLARLRPDLLHSTAFVAPVVSPCPVVVSIHDTTYLTQPHSRLWGVYTRLFTALATRRAAAILTLSESSKRDIVRHYHVPADRVAVVPLGVHPRFYPMNRPEAHVTLQARYGLSAPFILFVGALEVRKNIPVLLRAFAELKRTAVGQPYCLVIVGKPGGAWAEIQRTVDELALRRDVVFLGHVPTDDLPLFYSGAEVFAFPSLYEGFGIPVIEAMACATPVVTSNVSSLPEVGGEAALYVDPNDAAALAVALARVVGDPALRQALVEKGLARAPLFTWERVAEATGQVYAQVRQGSRNRVTAWGG